MFAPLRTWRPLRAAKSEILTQRTRRNGPESANQFFELLTWVLVRRTNGLSRQPPRSLFGVAVDSSAFRGFVLAQLPAAAAQLGVKATRRTKDLEMNLMFDTHQAPPTQRVVKSNYLHSHRLSFKEGGSRPTSSHFGAPIVLLLAWRCSLATSQADPAIDWGYNSYVFTNVLKGVTNVVALAAGDRHYLALKADGTVSTWGDNSEGQTNVPAGLTNVVRACQ